MVRLTIDHSASSYNIPVFVDGENNALDYADGIKKMRETKGWSTADMAEKLGTSKRTIEGWEQNRPVPKMALLLMQRLLDDDD